MGFYVRQSALIVPLTAFGFLLFFHKGRLVEIAKSFSFFLVGYIGVFLLVLISYSNFMEVGDLLTSGLSPFGFLTSATKKLPGLFGMSLQPAVSLSSPGDNVSYHNYTLYYRYVRQAFHMHSFLLVGLSFSVLTFCGHLLSRDKLRGKEPAISYSLLYLWAFVLFMAYAFFYHTRGFYIDYSREFLPPLVIIFSAWICHTVSRLEKNRALEHFILVGLCLSAIFFFIQSNYKTSVGGGQYASLAITLFALFNFVSVFKFSTRRLVFISALLAIVTLLLFSRQPLLKPYLSGVVPRLAIIGLIFTIPLALSGKELRPTLKDYTKFISLSAVLGAFVLSLAYSAITLNLSYDSPWSPQSLEKTSAYLRTHTRVTDTVMSGGLIWGLQALRRPFLNISHPLAFEFEISEKEKERLQSAIQTRPPEVVILDGFTERTYFRQIPRLTDFLDSKYELVHTAGLAKYPVRVYQLRDRLS
ncbi:MAG: hypothetical protein JRD93_07925 [Deltaproteobacteria bacterium]|nr:hypothetical protein [Deltaproteobacteria bacterium]